MNPSFFLALFSARICPWLGCSPSHLLSGDLFILALSSCFIFLKLALGPGWKEMHISLQTSCTCCSLCLVAFTQVFVWRAPSLPDLGSKGTCP